MTSYKFHKDIIEARLALVGISFWQDYFHFKVWQSRSRFLSVDFFLKGLLNVGIFSVELPAIVRSIGICEDVKLLAFFFPSLLE